MFQIDRLERRPADLPLIEDDGEAPMINEGTGSRYIFTDRDRRQVETMAGLGLTHEQIAAVMRIGISTLVRKFANELQVGTAEANFEVAKNLYSIATSREQGCVPAAIFWMKARAGWRQNDPQQDQAQQSVTIKIEGGLPELRVENGQISSDNKP
jgi:hypothetical protein